MVSGMFNRGSIPALEAMMHFTSARHKAIAANIANVDTVFYKALDAPEADFKKALARAYDGQRNSPTGVFEMEARRGLRPTATGLQVRFDESADAGILKHTENNVDLEIEMGKMVKNAGLHNMAASLLAHEFTMLREAISGRVFA
jgi:flagellar basal-body rod protein FlgB